MIRILACCLAATLLSLQTANAATQNAQVVPATAGAQDASAPASQPPSVSTPPEPDSPLTQPTAPTPVIAPAPPPPKPAKKGPVDSLKPGQFVWEQRASYTNPLRMVVVLDIQRLYVFDGDQLVGFSTISSGKRGKETPAGVFKILQKKVYHESNIYANAPMPFMQRLTWDGIAIHAGHLPGYPASHGCIRLPKRFAEALYGATQLEGEVVVLESLSKPLTRPTPVDPATGPTAVDSTVTPDAPTAGEAGAGVPQPEAPPPPATTPPPGRRTR